MTVATREICAIYTLDWFYTALMPSFGGFGKVLRMTLSSPGLFRRLSDEDIALCGVARDVGTSQSHSTFYWLHVVTEDSVANQMPEANRSTRIEALMPELLSQ